MIPVRFLRNTLHPERYQGVQRRYPYFEGQYYKLIDASEDHRYAVIPGIYKGGDVCPLPVDRVPGNRSGV